MQTDTTHEAHDPVKVEPGRSRPSRAHGSQHFSTQAGLGMGKSESQAALITSSETDGEREDPIRVVLSDYMIKTGKTAHQIANDMKLVYVDPEHSNPTSAVWPKKRSLISALTF
jgi:hypothetical protein